MNEIYTIFAKYTFLNNLYAYKEETYRFDELINKVTKKIEVLKSSPYNIKELSNIEFPNFSNMSSNKLISLANFFNQRNINLFYIEEKYNHQLYPFDYFSKNILSYYRTYFLDFANILKKIVDLIVKLEKRLSFLMDKHFLKCVISIVKRVDFYKTDDECLEIIQEINKQYALFHELENKFYMNNIKDDYLDIVKYNLDVQKKILNKNLIELLFEIDCDFCRNFECEDLIDKIADLYKASCIKANIDPSIIENKGDSLFTTREDDEFNPKMFITMNMDDLNNYKTSFELDYLLGLVNFSVKNEHSKDDRINNLKKFQETLTSKKEENTGENFGTMGQKKGIRL